MSLTHLRHAVRNLRKRPGFTTVLLVTMSLGIGASATVFSVVNGVLLRPLPYPRSADLVTVTTTIAAMNWTGFGVSKPLYLDLRDQLDGVSSLGAYETRDANLEAIEDPQRVSTALVDEGFFRTMAVNPERGRLVSSDDDYPGASKVAVISNGLWQRSLGAREDVIGTTMMLDGVAYEIIGVMPAAFQYPSPRTEIWTQLALAPELRNDRGQRGNHSLNVIGRVNEGLSVEQGRAFISGFNDWLSREHGDFYQPKFGFGLEMDGMHEQMVSKVRPALLALVAAVGMVLLIVCANVSHMILFRAESRLPEFSVRVALGASRRDLVYGVIAESGVLVVFAFGLGLLLAYAGLSAINTLEAGAIPDFAAITIDKSVLLFTFLISAVTALMFSIVPAWNAYNHDISATIKSSGRGSSGRRNRRVFRDTLVSVEVAMAVVLLIGAGLLLRSFDQLLEVDTGFDTGSVLTMQVSLPDTRYSQPSRVLDFFAETTESLQALPGVQNAAAVSFLPLYDEFERGALWIEDFPIDSDQVAADVNFEVVTAGFFATTGIPLVSGREFTSADRRNTLPVTVVNETLARQYWPDESAIGKRIKMFGEEWNTIIGVARDVKFAALDSGDEMQLYVAHQQYQPNSPFRSMTILVQTTGNPQQSVEAARATIAMIDPALALSNVQTMSHVREASVAQPRFMTVVVTLFGTIALALGAVGVYGVLAYAVSQRVREMGIRIALGATATGIIGNVMRDGLRPVGIGLFGGILVALISLRWISSILFEIPALDPVTYLGVIAIISLTAATATYIPARRAARVDPATVLGTE